MVQLQLGVFPEVAWACHSSKTPLLSEVIAASFYMHQSSPLQASREYTRATSRLSSYAPATTFSQLPPGQKPMPQPPPKRDPTTTATSAAPEADTSGLPTCRGGAETTPDPQGLHCLGTDLHLPHQLCKFSACGTSEQTTGAPAAEMGLTLAAVAFVGACM